MLNVKIKCHYDPSWETIKIRLLFKDTNFKIGSNGYSNTLRIFDDSSEFRSFFDNDIINIINSSKRRFYGKINCKFTDVNVSDFSAKNYPGVDVDKFMEELSEDLSSALEDAYIKKQLTNPIWSLNSTNSLQYVDWDDVSENFPFSKELICEYINYINFQKLLNNKNLPQDIKDYCRMFV